VEESDPGIVPMNQLNKVGLQATKEVGEGRPGTKENSSLSSMLPTQSGSSVSQGLWRVREAAKRNKKIHFSALLHHVTTSLLRNCFFALKRQAAPGVDGVTWQEYEQDLENRLTGLQSRIHRGAYRAQPSRRVYIPKADGRRRKVARGAVVTVRYADDLVVGFQYREDAERFQEELQTRLAKFGLELNTDKTRLIEFGRRAERDRKRRGEGKPETFNFLGFTHSCGRHRKGYFSLWRKTTRKRMVAKLRQP
jgi:hypothetical protein